MVEGESVPPHHVLARYCKRLQVVDGVVQGTAFQLDEGHPYHSVTSLDDVAPEAAQQEQVRAAKAAIVASGFNPKPNGWFALISVEAVARPLTDDGSGTRVLLETLCHPETGNSSHCGIHGLPANGSPQATNIGLELSWRVTEPAYTAEDVTPVRRCVS